MLKVNLVSHQWNNSEKPRIQLDIQASQEHLPNTPVEMLVPHQPKQASIQVYNAV